MPFNSRDMWVLLKAQDLATHALNSYSRSVKQAGVDTRLAQLEAAKGAAAAALQQNNLTNAARRTEIAQLANDKANIQNQISTGKLTGITQGQVFALESQKRAIDQQVISKRQDIVETDKNSNALKSQILQYDNQARVLKESSLKMDAHRAATQRLSAQFKSASQTAYALSFAITAIGVGGLIAMTSTIKSARDYDAQVRLTATQVDNLGGNFKLLADIGTKTANQIGTKFEEIQPALYDIFSSMTVTVEEASKDLQLFAKAAVAGQTDIQSVARGTIGIMNTFHLSAKDLNKILDIQFMFIKRGVGTYDEWTQKIGLVSPSAIRAGQGIEMMMAAMAEGSRELGNIPATTAGVARAFDAFSNPKAVAGMKAIGVAAVDSKGNFRDFSVVMEELRTKLASMSTIDQRKAFNQIFSGAGNNIQARRFLQNLLFAKGNLESFKTILGDVKNSSGSMQTAYEIMSNSVAAKSELLRNKWMILKTTLGNILMPIFLQAIGIVQRIVDWFNNLSPSTQNLIVKVTALALAFAAVVGPILALIGFIAGVASALAAVGLGLGEVLLIIAGVGLAIAGLATAFTTAMTKSKPFRDLLKSIGETATDIWKNHIVPFADGMKKKFEEDLKPALDKLWTAINDKILPVLQSLWDTFSKKIKPALDEVFNDLQKVADKGYKYLSEVIEKYLIPTLEKVKNFYEEHKQGIDKIISALMFLGKWIAIIVGGSAFGALIAIITIVIVVMSTAIRIWMTLIEWVNRTINVIKAVISWLWNLNKTFGSWADAVGSAIGKALSWIGSLPGRVASAVGNLGNTLYNAGKAVIDGLINGIKSSLGALGSFLSGVGNFIKSHKGPASKDAIMLRENGQLIMSGLIRGIGDMIPNLESQLGNVTDRIKMQGSINIGNGVNSSGATQTGGYDGQKIITINNNVYTQEIRPEYHAAQLGALIAGRVA